MADFTFTPISNSNGPYKLFVESSINDAGTVAFEGIQSYCESIGGDCLQVGTTTPPAAIFTGNGNGSTTTIIDKSSYGGFSGYNSATFFAPSINNAGTTAFAASVYNSGQLVVPGPTAVLSGSGGPINTVAYSSQPFSFALVNPNGNPNDFSNYGAAGNFVTAAIINNAGTVAYVKGQNGETGIYSTTRGGATTTIADTSGPLSNFYNGGFFVTRNANPFSAYTLPDINDQGTVAFNATLDTGGRGIFTGNGQQTTKIADTSEGFTYFSSPSINDSGTLAFNAGLNTGDSAIFASTDGKLTTIADTSGSFSSFRSDVAINELGKVAFLADLDNNSRGLFTGSKDLGFKEVIAVGDTLGGSTVTQLRISRNGLNDAGQIAFDAVLADGSQSIFRAEPVPEPSDGIISVLALAIFSMVGYRWRRRIRFAKHTR